jgi:hypothetical protein
MKKKIIFICMSVLLLSLTSCVEQTELSTDTLPATVVVTGYVRYIALNKDLKQDDPEIVDKGHVVNIYYGVPDAEGKVSYAFKTINVDADAFFNTTLGCPVGKSIKVKVQSSMYGESYAANEEGKKVSCDAYFFGEKETTISCGSAHCFKLDMTPVAKYGEDNLIQ